MPISLEVSLMIGGGEKYFLCYIFSFPSTPMASCVSTIHTQFRYVSWVGLLEYIIRYNFYNIVTLYMIFSMYFLFKKQNKMFDQPWLSTDFNHLGLNKNHVDKNQIMEVLLLIFGM